MTAYTSLPSGDDISVVLDLYRWSSPFLSGDKKLAQHDVYDFEQDSGYIFAFETNRGAQSERRMFVSTDGGHTFAAAIFPGAGRVNSVRVVDASEQMVFAVAQHTVSAMRGGTLAALWAFVMWSWERLVLVVFCLVCRVFPLRLGWPALFVCSSSLSLPTARCRPFLPFLPDFEVIVTLKDSRYTLQAVKPLFSPALSDQIPGRPFVEKENPTGCGEGTQTYQPISSGAKGKFVILQRGGGCTFIEKVRATWRARLACLPLARPLSSSLSLSALFSLSLLYPPLSPSLLAPSPLPYPNPPSSSSFGMRRPRAPRVSCSSTQRTTLTSSRAPPTTLRGRRFP